MTVFPVSEWDAYHEQVQLAAAILTASSATMATVSHGMLTGNVTTSMIVEITATKIIVLV